jgi:hypothetical protein
MQVPQCFFLNCAVQFCTLYIGVHGHDVEGSLFSLTASLQGQPNQANLILPGVTYFGFVQASKCALL